MRILLVAPKNPESFWTFDRILPTLKRKAAFPNLALPTLAALTPREHAVTLVDENVREIDFDARVDLVGVTGYVIHRARIHEIAAEFRRRGRFVVVGGTYASSSPDECAGIADAVFVDEAEHTWPEFLSDLAAGRPRARYQAEERPSLAASPVPRFDLLELSRYRSVTLQFARGCPYRCDFCDITVMYGHAPRTKRVPQLLAELDELHRLGVRNAFLVDDNFIGNRRLAREALAGIAAWQRARTSPIELMTEVSINVADDDELLRGLRDANFSSLFIGIESPREASLRDARKTQNTRGDLLESVRRIQAYGIQVSAGMIVGFDADDASIFEEQFRFIQGARIPISMTGMLNALPRTALHQRLARDGRLVAASVGDQFAFTNVVPARMSRAQLYAGYRDLLRRLYDFRNYRRRTLAYLFSRGERLPAPLVAARGDLAIGWRIVRDCLLVASPRRAWMSAVLLLGTLLRRPSALREALALTLMHRHFHDYAERVARNLDVAIAAEAAAAELKPA
jgi:radical SAM superfamily enzyme YgiQ (UPF0313 family)